MAKVKRRRAKGQGGVRKQRGRYSPFFPTKDENGATIVHRAGRSFETKAEALGWLTAIREKFAACKTGTEKTLLSAVNDWLGGSLKIKPQTRHRYEQTRDKAASHLERIALFGASAATLEAWLNALPFSTAEKEKVYGILNQSFKRLVRLELLDRNPLANVIKPVPQRKKPAPFTQEQSHQLLRAIVGDPLESLYLVLLTTGIRPGEAFALDWENVDFERQAINVNATLADFGGTHEVSPSAKTASGNRWIKLTRLAWESLEDLAIDGNRQGAVWKTTRGHRFRKTNFYRRQWAPLLTKAGLPSRRLYELRHGFATLSLLNGVPLRVVSQMLGHSDSGFTAKVYSHVFEDSQLAFVDKIEAAFAIPTDHSVPDSVPTDQATEQTEAIQVSAA